MLKELMNGLIINGKGKNITEKKTNKLGAKFVLKEN